MPDVIPTPTRSDRYSLGASLACFAVAGAATAVADAVEPTLGATAVAIAGVYLAARYARSVPRRALARGALGLWLAFIGVAGVHAAGLGTVGAVLPGPTPAVAVAVAAATWATLLGACASTVFLACREYGSPATDGPDEQVLEGEASDYSTR